MRNQLTTTIFLVIAITFSFSYSRAQVTSTFDIDDEGWTLSGDATSPTPNYLSTGGNPGGCLSASDNGGGVYWYWSAPSKFLGNNSSIKTLKFDLRQSGLNDQRDEPDIIIEGSGITLMCEISPNPALTWTHYEVALTTATNWKVETLNGATATESQINDVLANITMLLIRGEYIEGPDTGFLDNVSFSSEVLPIYLLSFSAKNDNRKVKIEWSTSLEINSSHFEIYHSDNGIHFNSIGTLNAKGNSSVINTYSFTHSQPIISKNFYRLRMVDKDGTFKYSEVLSVAFEESTDVAVYPNPATNKITLTGLSSNWLTNIQVVDITGKTVQRLTTNSNSILINTSLYQAGIYFVRVISNNKIHLLRVRIK